MKEVMFTFTIRFKNGVQKQKKMSIEKDLVIHLVRRLRMQYPTAVVDWEGSDGTTGTTELK